MSIENLENLNLTSKNYNSGHKWEHNVKLALINHSGRKMSEVLFFEVSILVGDHYWSVIFCGVMNSIRDTSLHNDLNLEEVPIKNVVAKSAFLLKYAHLLGMP